MPRSLALLLLLLLGGCLSTHPKASDDLASVVVEDGINQHEAGILAKRYFARFISGCGVVGDPIDHGDYFDCPTYIGVASVPGKPIRVDKTTVHISWPGGPDIYDLKDLRRPPNLPAN
jgi:hypothetical protein